MTRTLAALFLLAHGFVHAAVWAAPGPREAQAPFDPRHSWLLAAVHVAADPARTTALGLAWAATGLYALAALLLVAGAGVWAPAAAAAALVAALLKVTFFNTWLTLGVLLDVAVLTAVAAAWPPSLF
jgi:hypothetical protein